MANKVAGTCYVLHSGGIDSSVCLAYAVNTFENVIALSVNYGQRHQRELDCARTLRGFYDIDSKELPLSLGIGGLTDPNQVIPQVGYDQIEGVSPSYVPFRNGALLSLATSQAQGDPEGVGVMYGAHAEDAANWAYPDCTPEFIGAMASAIYIGTYHRVRLYTPLMWMDKASVVTLGAKLGVPFQYTWSCYEAGAVHCGVCPTCRARQLAFRTAGIPDPTAYFEQLP